MKQEDLNCVKSDYELFNKMLFNNSLPSADKIDFILHNIPMAVGYSKHRRIPSKTGNVHEIAFCKYYVFDRDFFREVLIHEMIHLWQDSHVSVKRYKRCSWQVAHDRVFTSKMNTINLILKRNLYDIKIDTICEKDLELDDFWGSKTFFYMFFFETNFGQHMMLKTLAKNLKSLKSEIQEKNDKEQAFQNVFYIKTKSYRYNLINSVKDSNFLVKAIDNNTREDLYELSLNENPVWIIKDSININ